MEYKIIHDPVHGSIKVRGIMLELLATPEVQRLSGVKQLGISYFVFPGANHTRLEHSLGVGHLAERISSIIGLTAEEREVLVAAGILHDVGHAPFSHTLEMVVKHRSGLDHMGVGARIIRGHLRNVESDYEHETVGEVLERHSIDPEDICAFIEGRRPPPEVSLLLRGRESAWKEYMWDVIHGSLDADQMDYLLRDAHYTGVAHGLVDLDRILNTVMVHRGRLAIDRKGLNAAEGMLVARALMYSSVYFHKTARIAELMVSRALEESGIGDYLRIYGMTDGELLSFLLNSGGYSRDMALRIKYRKLFKRALTLGVEDIPEDAVDELARLADLDRRRRVEDEIATASGLEPGYVLIDIPLINLNLSEPRIAKTDVLIHDHGRLLSLSQCSPLARALQVRRVVNYIIMVAAPREHTERVAKETRRVLGL